MEQESRTRESNAAGTLEVTSTVKASPIVPNPQVTKLIVAVHGVGDQYSFATIQSVVNQFCGFFGTPAGIPLGSFHTGQPGFSIPPPYPRDPFERLGFAEVYWAKIPRTIVDEKHTLEEAKKWAHTIVERLKLRWHLLGSKGGCRDEDFSRVQLVLTEMIQTIAVLDRICLIAQKAGLFTFDLRRLLDDYLGDVQIVTEFKENRDQILKAFKDVLDTAHETFPSAEIYIVAHSEGTVVALLGLLQALRETPPPPWSMLIRGMMTLGSPIDKHLLMWPELFGTTPPTITLPRKIEWRNYYDYGDPIGFALDDARKWLKGRGWDGVFNFVERDDIGFTRYPFPGKAHVDYWTDKDLFGHFIQTVIGEKPSASPKKGESDFSRPPRTRRWSQWFSYVVPYAGILTLCFVASYILFKVVTEATDPQGALTPYTNSMIAWDVTGIAMLIAGVTVVSRIPRLTRRPLWRAVAWAIALGAGALYFWTVRNAASTSVFGLRVVGGGITLTLALLLIWMVYKVGDLKPSWGLTPLIIGGTAIVAGRVGWHLWSAQETHDIGPLWPVFIGTAAFLYLWWIGALLFDLIFVWHLYIRNAELLQRMDEIMGQSDVRPDAVRQRSLISRGGH